MRLVNLLATLLLFAFTLAGQSTPEVDENVLLEVSIANSQTAFHIGEAIPLKLTYRSKIEKRYQLNMARYDRSGRMDYERFVVTPAEGAVDPLPNHPGSMGGLTSHQYLKPEPAIIEINLNEWIRFSQPREYRLTVFSSRATTRSPETSSSESPVIARSNEIQIKITSASPEWQKQTLQEALKALDAPRPRDPNQLTADAALRGKAVETLRFLGTAEAVREMIKRRNDQESDAYYIYQMGIITSPARAAARSAMEEALADPDQPIDSGFLYVLRVINTDPGAATALWRQEQRRAMERLLAVLPVKRGKALTISLSTVVNEAWNGEGLAKDLMDKLVSQLVSVFDQLPVREQNALLGYRWDQIKSPALLPLLKRRAGIYQNFPEMRDSGAYESLQLSANALLHWYEMDPESARPAIIAEIMRPRPRYGVQVLGVLPEKTLPEVDSALAEHFLANEDLDGSEHLASLIARYATEAVLPRITERLDRRIGKWACSIQAPILAYALRSDPSIARPRIEKAVAARGANFSACNHSLFSAVAAIHYDPVLEEIAIRSLDDDDPEVALSAAGMLGQYGSASAESFLWRRYESWSSQWAGRESQLDQVFSDGLNDRVYQLGLGENLLRALARGSSWLSDQSKLQSLSRLTTVPRLRRDLEGYLKAWDGQALTIEVQNYSAKNFWCRVAQYEYTSIADLKNKLSQFPPNTKFVFGNMPGESSPNDKSIAEVREFLLNHGMKIVEEKR